MSVEPNDNTELRAATIELRDAQGKALDKFTIIQKPKAVEEEESVFEIDAEGSYTIPAEGAEIKVTITTNLEYRVEVSEDAKAWLSIGDTRAVRTETLVFTASKNESDRERTATITIFNKDDEKIFEFRLTQKFNDKADIPEYIFFGLDKESFTFSPDGGSVDVVVYSNYKWEILGTSDWCTPSVKSGDANEDGQKVTFSADMTYDDREAIFWFRCADKQEKFVVSQKFKETIIPDANNSFNIPAEGGVAVISYQTTVDCEVIIPEEAQDWITIAPATRGLSTYSTTLNIAENNPGKRRSCVVKVVSKDNNKLSAEYTIIQNSRYCLYYTSSNGEIVQPNNSSAFGATLISNTYIDGVGAIDFNAPITTIGDHAFDECSSLTSVTIPDSVTTIGNYAFWGCSSLTSVTIGDSVTTIGERAFWGCSSLTSVAIGDSVTTIGEGAFAYCYDLTSVTIPDSVTTIEYWAFYWCTSLTSVTIGDSVTEIGYDAFYSCSSLQEFNGKFASEDGRCLIIDGVLNYFAPVGLTEYTIPDSVTKIGSSAFRGCSRLTSITIPDSVTTIGEDAFYYCSSLTSVTIPDSVTTIGEWAFGYCRSLTSVTIPDSVTTIGESAFSDCSSLQEFNGKFASEDGRCLIIDGVLNSFAPAGLTEYTIPNSVTTIGEYAFYDCINLTSVTIPDSVTSIGNDAFYWCKSLTSVTIPNSVTTIGDFAFKNCSSLTSVTIPDSVTEIGFSAFYECSSLTSVYCKATTPPAGANSMFDDNVSGRKIYVPMESVEAYKSASYWSIYKSDIVGYNF